MQAGFAGKQRTRPITKEGLHTAASGSGYKMVSQKSDKSQGPLVQATISTLFKKVEEKGSLPPWTCGGNNAAVDGNDPSLQEASGEKSQRLGQQKAKQLKAIKQSMKKKPSSGKRTGSGSTTRMEQDEVEEDDIEEFSSSSQDTDGSDEDDSDEDWAE
ncbi:hypothetical protein Dimus_027398 [Dionaea muscipula]